MKILIRQIETYSIDQMLPFGIGGNLEPDASIAR